MLPIGPCRSARTIRMVVIDAYDPQAKVVEDIIETWSTLMLQTFNMRGPASPNTHLRFGSTKLEDTRFGLSDARILRDAEREGYGRVRNSSFCL